MSTALAVAPSPGMGPLPVEIVERVMIQGDLSKLDPKQKLAYYQARCEAAGLNIVTRPFEYLSLNGKLVLYATKSCTDSLAGMHKLSVEVPRHGPDCEGSVYTAEAVVTFPDGRRCQDIGVVPIDGLKRELLANAMMKAVTKAKRRTILSACGLGDIIDESELDTVRDARRVTEADVAPPQNQSGYGKGMYASPEDTKTYLKWLEKGISERLQRWWDSWELEVFDGLPQNLKDPLRLQQADNHLVKWCKATGRLDPATDDEDYRHHVMGRYVAIWFCKKDDEGRYTDRKAIVSEMTRYADLQFALATQGIYRKRPDLKPVEAEEESQDVEFTSAEREPGED